MGGVAAVQDAGGEVSGKLGMRLTDRIDVFGEGAWMQNVISRRRIGLAEVLASSLGASQGKPASGTIKAPASYGGGGIRVALKTNGRVRPYVTFGAGAARLVLTPEFTLAGSDVTRNLAQYGVTLGSDLTGETTKAAYGGGFGVQMVQRWYYIDVSLRATSIQTEGQTTTVKRAGAGIGVRF